MGPKRKFFTTLHNRANIVLTLASIFYHMHAHKLNMYLKQNKKNDSTGNVLILQTMAFFSGAYLTEPVAAYMAIMMRNTFTTKHVTCA